MGKNGVAMLELEDLQHFLLTRPRAMAARLILGPHHDVGVSTDLKERAMEYAHHRDPLVPRQQRFGQYTRSVMKGLGVPVHRAYLPARVLAFAEDVPIGEGRHPIDGQPAAYVCRHRTCDAPVTSVKALLERCAA
jgi:hypothetical protein